MNTSTAQSFTFPADAAFAAYMVEMLRCKAHIWVEEQQTGHRVCAWCNYCKGGC